MKRALYLPLSDLRLRLHRAITLSVFASFLATATPSIATPRSLSSEAAAQASSQKAPKASNFHLDQCSLLLSKTWSKIQRVVRPVPATAQGDQRDYRPDEYARLDLAERYISVYNRIQARNHRSAKTVFFYDYEVRDVIETMESELQDARDFTVVSSDSSTRALEKNRHAEALQILRKKIDGYKASRTVDYLDFHETTLLFAQFQMKGLKSTPSFKMKDRDWYSHEGYKWTWDQIEPYLKNSGFKDYERQELDWGRDRIRLLYKAPQAIFIPSFEELNEEFFIATASYPVFPAGMTTDVNWVGDGQLYGPVQLMLHDFYHGKWAMKSIDYSLKAIAAREDRRRSFNDASQKIENLELRRLVRVLYMYLGHEETGRGGEFVQFSKSQHLRANLLDPLTFEYIRERLFHRPYDFGDMFQTKPTFNNLMAARDWLADFYLNDSHYP